MNSPNIIAKVIADSVTFAGHRLTTFEIEYPRFILAELNTHRMLSKNSASSRAIPIAAMHSYIKANPAEPTHWGKNQPGMQAHEEVGGSDRSWAQYLWHKAKDAALQHAQELADTGVHKQIANRVTEPWMTMKTVISGTEWANFYYLRDHPDAQPEIAELAHKMYLAHKASTPQELKHGEWHLPYVETRRGVNGELQYISPVSNHPYTLEDAKMVSASCCAQVSYRRQDDSISKAYKIYDQLINSKPAHASPVEHQATPMPHRFGIGEETRHPFWPPGVTHQDRAGNYWSGNLQGWIQHRKLIQDEAVWGQIK